LHARAHSAPHPQNCHLLYNWTLVNSTVYNVDYFVAPPLPPLAAGPTGGIDTMIFSDPSVLAPTLTLPAPGRCQCQSVRERS
jgi:hypothetical protein